MNALVALGLSFVVALAASVFPSRTTDKVQPSLLAATTPPAAAPGPDAEALIAKLRAYMGWTLGDASVKSLRIKGRIADQLTFDEICEQSRFAQFNVGIVSGRSFLIESGPGWAWISHAGHLNVLPDNVGQDAFTESLLLCNAFLNYPATLIRLDSTGPGEVHRSTAIVALAIPNEPTVSLLIDPSTGALTEVIVNDVATYEPADLCNIDGSRRIYARWKREISDTATADMSISSVQPNASVDPNIFSKTALDVAPPPDPAPISASCLPQS